MPKHQKIPMADGLTFLMRNPETNPTTPEGKRVFNEMIKQSGMTVSDTLKYVGKRSKRGPTDDERSKQRLEKLEQ